MLPVNHRIMTAPFCFNYPMLKGRANFLSCTHCYSSSLSLSVGHLCLANATVDAAFAPIRLCLPADSLPSPRSSCPGLLYCHGYSHETCPGTQKTLSCINTYLPVMPQIATPRSSVPALGFYTVAATVTRLVLEL